MGETKKQAKKQSWKNVFFISRKEWVYLEWKKSYYYIDNSTVRPISDQYNIQPWEIKGERSYSRQIINHR